MHALGFLRGFCAGSICDCADQLVSELVGNPNCWFSHAKAHFSFMSDLKDTVDWNVLLFPLTVTQTI